MIIPLDDTCDASWWERTHHFLDNIVGKSDKYPEGSFERKAYYQNRAELLPDAQMQATGEMLDEIHSMLRLLVNQLPVPLVEKDK